MAELKTRPNKASVRQYIASLESDVRKSESKQIFALMRRVTGHRAKMWGESIVGFGSYHYMYESGREGDWLLTGFSPRKQNMTIYVMNGFSDYKKLLAKLGKHKHSKSCLYLPRVENVDLGILEEIVTRSVAHMRRSYDCSA